MNDPAAAMTAIPIQDLTPARIVRELDQHIIGQAEAKRAVAIAIRNRWRRQQLAEDMKAEVTPKNILMIGPTGVGKTEIARRVSTLVQAPFLKVEASKYTEVGYHGRDVESMVRDLVEVAYGLSRRRFMQTVGGEAARRAEEALLDALLPLPAARVTEAPAADGETEAARQQRSRDKMRAKLRAGELEEQEIEIDVDERAGAGVEVVGTQGYEQMGVDLGAMLQNMFPGRVKRRRVKVREARRLLEQAEADKLIDKDRLRDDALTAAQQSGIIFIDEIDKIAMPAEGRGPDVSRGGVQRDLLPIVEGCTVNTRHGIVSTEHILFVAAGAFSKCKPSDLIPELQGRFPIRVELQDLTEADFIRILAEPRNAITKQYQALLRTEGVEVIFEEGGVRELARIAAAVNLKTQNVGARRLSTVVEKLLEEISFHAPDVAPQTVRVTAEYVRQILQPILSDEDLTRYIL